MRRLQAVAKVYRTNLLTAAASNLTLGQTVFAKRQYEALLMPELDLSAGDAAFVRNCLARPELALAGVAHRGWAIDGNSMWTFDEIEEDAEEVPLTGVQTDRRSICPLVRSHSELCEMVLDMSGVDASSCVADLGCGDGRMLLKAARRGAHAIGFDVNPFCLRRARTAAANANLSHLIDVIDADICGPHAASHGGFQAATLVYVYLVPPVVARLEPLLRAAVAAGKTVAIFCTTGASNAKSAGNAIGDLPPAQTALNGMLRIYRLGPLSTPSLVKSQQDQLDEQQEKPTASQTLHGLPTERADVHDDLDGTHSQASPTKMCMSAILLRVCNRASGRNTRKAVHEWAFSGAIAGSFKIVPVAGRGLGVVATRAFATGDLVLADQPLLRWRQDVEASREENFAALEAALAALDASAAAKFWALTQSARTYGDSKTLLGIFLSNAYPTMPPTGREGSGDGHHCDYDSDDANGEGEGGEATDGEPRFVSAAVYTNFSRFNHACDPNTIEQDWQREAGAVVIRAARPIAVGDELTTTYIGAEACNAPRESRRAYLRAKFDFECSCALCERER